MNIHLRKCVIHWLYYFFLFKLNFCSVIRQRLTHFNCAQTLKNASNLGVSIFDCYFPKFLKRRIVTSLNDHFGLNLLRVNFKWQISPLRLSSGGNWSFENFSKIFSMTSYWPIVTEIVANSNKSSFLVRNNFLSLTKFAYRYF